jgi:hypothetical protein
LDQKIGPKFQLQRQYLILPPVSLTLFEKVLKRGGSGLLSLFGGSLSKVVSTAYEEFSSQPWKLEQVSKGYWENLENRRNFLDWLAEELALEFVEDWYSIDRPSLITRGAAGLLEYHGNWPSNAFIHNYPDTHWQPWRFEKLPYLFLESGDIKRDYIEWLEDKLDVVRPEDWYGLTSEHVAAFWGSIFIRNAGKKFP